MVMVKGEQNHQKTIDVNGSRRKKTIVSHRSQKMTIVHCTGSASYWLKSLAIIRFKCIADFCEFRPKLASVICGRHLISLVGNNLDLSGIHQQC